MRLVIFKVLKEPLHAKVACRVHAGDSNRQVRLFDPPDHTPVHVFPLSVEQAEVAMRDRNYRVVGISSIVRVKGKVRIEEQWTEQLLEHCKGRYVNRVGFEASSVLSCFDVLSNSIDVIGQLQVRLLPRVPEFVSSGAD